MITTEPGFSSRSTDQQTKQFPQRDEAAMSDVQHPPGFSNSAPVEDAPQDVHPEVEPLPPYEPGQSNSAPSGEYEPPEQGVHLVTTPGASAEHLAKVSGVQADQAPDVEQVSEPAAPAKKAAAPRAPRKAAANKTAAKKES